MKSVLILPLSLLTFSFLRGMENAALQQQPDARFNFSIDNSSERSQAETESDLRNAQFWNRYAQMRDEIVTNLMNCQDSTTVRNLLSKLETHCRKTPYKLTNTEIKAAAEVARNTAKAESDTATSAATQIGFYSPLYYTSAFQWAEYYKTRYLNAETNRGYVQTAHRLINTAHDDDEESGSESNG